MLPIREAAEYCGLPVKRFAAECGVSPVEVSTGLRLYDMRDLDSWIDALKDGDPHGDDDIVGRLR